MDETEDELSNFRILKRIGFTHTDMLKGLLLKITFNFGFTIIDCYITCSIRRNSIYEIDG